MQNDYHNSYTAGDNNNYKRIGLLQIAYRTKITEYKVH